MSKGSKRRPSLVTDERLLANWDRVFNSKPSANQFDQNGAVQLHIEKVKWRDEMVAEDHQRSLEGKNDGKKSNI